MQKTHKKHLTTEQTNLRLTMIAMQDQRAPFYAGQDVSVWDPQRCLWVPAKVIRHTAD